MAKRRNPFQQRSIAVTIPPPVGGWNARDALASMPQTDAVTLDNFTPGSTDVTLRNGYETHVTGLGPRIESLIEYNPPDSSGRKLFAATPSAIYDVTTAGAVGAAVVDTLTSGRWQHTMMATAGGNFLVICNGADSVRNYNGSAWSTPTITGVSSSSLVSVCNHQNRLWFAQTNSLKAWYLAGASIAGAATEFNLGPLCRLGGHIQAIGTITNDGGAGLDDKLAFITSRGEVLIYSGIDPNDAALWVLEGVYKIPEPIGRRCLIRIGADLGVLTSAGLVPLSGVLPLSPSGQQQSAASEKIGPAFESAYRSSGSLFGWQVVEYPKHGLMVVNVPIEEGRRQNQFVMNSATGAWARWTDINASCWSLFGDTLYFADNSGNINQMTEEFTDNGLPIRALAITAFNRFGNAQRKHFREARVLATGPAEYYPGLAVVVDYTTTGVNFSYPTPQSASMSYWGLGLWGAIVWGAGSGLSVLPSPQWDVAEWDAAEWGAESVSLSSWQGVSGFGVAGAVAVSLELSDRYTINGVDLIYEQGGLL